MKTVFATLHSAFPYLCERVCVCACVRALVFILSNGGGGGTGMIRNLNRERMGCYVKHDPKPVVRQPLAWDAFVPLRALLGQTGSPAEASAEAEVFFLCPRDKEHALPLQECRSA